MAKAPNESHTSTRSDDAFTAEAAEVHNATRAIVDVYERVAEMLVHEPAAAMLAFGVPASIFRGLKSELRAGRANPLAWRLDLAHTHEGYKLLELNADSPGLVLETPAIANALGDALAGSVQKYTGARIVVASFNNPDETELARFYQRLLAQRGIASGSAFVERLTFDDDALYDSDGAKIDVLLSASPVQWLWRGAVRGRHDRGSWLDAERLADLMARGRLNVANGLGGIVFENKALQSLIWSLRDSRRFSNAQRHAIRTHFLPTYLRPPKELRSYAAKPVLGSRGDSIMLVKDGREVLRSERSTFTEQPYVFQELVVPPPTVVTSCFFIDGCACGIVSRRGDGITDDSWDIGNR